MRTAFHKIDRWSAKQCYRCMVRLNGESVRFDVVAADLAFYREHCSWICALAAARRLYI